MSKEYRLSDFLKKVINTDQMWGDIGKYVRKYHPLCPLEENKIATFVQLSLALGVTVKFTATGAQLNAAIKQYPGSTHGTKFYYAAPFGRIPIHKIQSPGGVASFSGTVEYLWNDKTWTPGSCTLTWNEGGQATIKDYVPPTRPATAEETRRSSSAPIVKTTEQQVVPPTPPKDHDSHLEVREKGKDKRYALKWDTFDVELPLSPVWGIRGVKNTGWEKRTIDRDTELAYAYNTKKRIAIVTATDHLQVEKLLKRIASPFFEGGVMTCIVIPNLYLWKTGDWTIVGVDEHVKYQAYIRREKITFPYLDIAYKEYSEAPDREQLKKLVTSPGTTTTRELLDKTDKSTLWIATDTREREWHNPETFKGWTITKAEKRTWWTGLVGSGYTLMYFLQVQRDASTLRTLVIPPHKGKRWHQKQPHTGKESLKLISPAGKTEDVTWKKMNEDGLYFGIHPDFAWKTLATAE